MADLQKQLATLSSENECRAIFAAVTVWLHECLSTTHLALFYPFYAIFPNIIINFVRVNSTSCKRKSDFIINHDDQLGSLLAVGQQQQSIDHIYLNMDKISVPDEVKGWMNMIGCAVTICDKEGVVLYMNERSRLTFAKHGDMVGRNLFGCHSERSQQMIRHMLASGDTNAYTIEKEGVRKLIYQTPWRDSQGRIAGMAEISIPLPPDMPHYIR